LIGDLNSMDRSLDIRLPDRSLWPTMVDTETTVCDIVTYLSTFWKLPVDCISICHNNNPLVHDAKILSVDPEPNLCVCVRFPDSPPPAADPSVDLAAIDPREQERILQRIRQAQVNQNRQQANAMHPRRLDRKIRCLVCKVHGRSLRMIVDTGASLSLLYMNQVECISVAYLIDRSEECRVSLTGVGESVHQAIGVIHSLKVEVGSVVTFVAFAILEQSAVHGLLGIDWLRQANATIRVVEDTIEIGGVQIPLEDP
jgi:hypothetical protein